MEKKSFEGMPCSVARSLEHVGEWWNILILRDAMMGITRFDDFQTSLGIGPNTLSRRLNQLVESDLLARRRYNERPPRDEYVLTEKGKDFLPVVAALMAWGNKHYSEQGLDTLMINSEDQAIIDPVVIDKNSGAEIHFDQVLFAAGPASGSLKNQHFAHLGLPVLGKH